MLGGRGRDEAVVCGEVAAPSRPSPHRSSPACCLCAALTLVEVIV